LFSAHFERNHSRDYPELVRQTNKKFLPAAGMAIRAQAVLLCPWDTGNLRGSITWRTQSEQGDFGQENRTGTMIDPPGKDQVAIGTNVDYAQHVEYGARGKPARSYLRRAIDELRKRLDKMWQQYFRETVKSGGY
jgi:hypothetical protein